MNFIRELKSLEIISSKSNIKIETFQTIEETEKTLTIKYVEYIPEFVRGFVCDIEHIYSIVNDRGEKLDRDLVCLHHNLVLVYVYKVVHIDSIPQFEYVFYK